MKLLRKHPILSSVAAAGICMAPLAAAAQSSPSYGGSTYTGSSMSGYSGSGLSSSGMSGSTMSSSGMSSSSMPSSSMTGTMSGSSMGSGAGTVTPTPLYRSDSSPAMSSGMDRHAMGSHTAGTLMPSEVSPPDALRNDPAMWDQWQKHGQYEYERGYEAGRRDAATYMRSNMMEDRENRSTYHSTYRGSDGSGSTHTRMSERYTPPPAAPDYRSSGYGTSPYATHASPEPYWAESWERMAQDWPRLREEIRRQWPQLSSYDLDSIQGERSMLLSVLQDRYRLSNERAHEQVLNWQRRISG